ncbi:serine/threonine-protein kinase [Streptomyces aculeolatus]
MSTPRGAEPGGREAGARVGPYRLVRLLGAGGMGEVHLARAEDGRHVALKLVHEELAADPEFRARFRQEVDAARRVLSFFTVPLVAAGPDDPAPWLATQYVPGPSLAQAVAADGPLPPRRLCSLAAALGEALVVVHAAGIVHRDLKPSNVLLADDGPRVIDFGIARAADATGLTGTGMAIGTLGYASPEQLVDDGPVGPAGDVYSLGAVLLYAATGRPPYGDAPAATLAYWTVHGTPDVTGVPAELADLVRTCLAREPADRPTPAEVIAAARAAESPDPEAPDPGSPHPGTQRSPGAGGAPAPGRGATTSYPLAPPRSPAPTAAADRSGLRRLAARPVALAATAAVTTAALRAGAFLLLPGDDDGGESCAGPGTTSPRTPAGGKDGDKGEGKGGGRTAAPEPSGPAADSPAGVTAAGDRVRDWRAPVSGTENQTALVGGWLTDQAAARTDSRGTLGLDPADGSRLWSVPPPKGSAVACRTSQGRTATHDGIGAVVYGDRDDGLDDCGVVGAVDTAAGKLLWQRETGGSSTRSPTVGMSGGLLVIAAEKGVLGLDPRTGDERWQRTEGIDGCQLSDALTGPRTTVLMETCGRATNPNTVVELDSATGKERWRFELPDNATESWPLTAEPVSVQLGRGGDGSKNALLVIDRTGKYHHEIPRNTPFGEMNLRGAEDIALPWIGAYGDSVVVAVEAPSVVSPDRLAAIDAVTGEIRWHKGLTFGAPSILSVDGESVTVRTEFGTEDEVHLVEYALDDGEVLGDGTLPASFEDPTDRRVAAAGDRVVSFIGRRATGAEGYTVRDGG